MRDTQFWFAVEEALAGSKGPEKRAAERRKICSPRREPWVAQHH